MLTRREPVRTPGDFTLLRRYEREEGRLARSLAERLADTDAERASPPEENHP